MDDKNTVTTRGTTFDNEENLSEVFIRNIKKKFDNSRLGRQELYAELLFEEENALWPRSSIKYKKPEGLARIVVAIDPAVTYNSGSDETGIVVVGKDANGYAFVLGDASGRYHPNVWGKLAVEKFYQSGADRIVAEVNQGGDLVGEVIRSFDKNVPYTAVRASRGKFTRAEPIAALYEQGLVFHTSVFPELEQQMCNFIPGGSRKSPDRVDALVWGITELFKLEIDGISVWGCT
jgi:predicted phage terminase large subunit-like protein